MQVVEHSTNARVGLLGNPSDGYGGRVLAFTIAEFRAEVRFEAAPLPWTELVSGSGEITAVQNPKELAGMLREGALREGAELLGAAVAVFFLSRDGIPGGFRLSFKTDIPRQVGLAGSSAIVLAALRCLYAAFGRNDHAVFLARHALRAETDMLGISAGPQDRVVQAYGGLLYMDFASPRWGADSMHRLSVPLPPLFLAHGPPAESSGAVHAPIAKRFEEGDPDVKRTMQGLGDLAELGRGQLERGDYHGLRRSVDRNFDLRAELWSIKGKALEAVSIGRDHGAAVKFAGSGGAVVGLPKSDDDFAALEEAYEEAGYAFLRPTLGPAVEEPPS